MLTFPFGMPIEPVRQTDRKHKLVFVLGVYASAVHARWLREDGSIIINALAIASEPEIFWRGDGAHEIVSRVTMPRGAGRLLPASPSLNGPSGVALDEMFLSPLKIRREQTWLCDLLPESRCNPMQAAALKREYIPRIAPLGLPDFNFPPVPKDLASEARADEIEREVVEASPSVLITLGDQPLKWFAARYGAHSTLAAYGETERDYGRLHDIDIEGRRIKLLPLVHPRQARGLGSHSPKWKALHAGWMSPNEAGALLGSIGA